MRQLAQDLTIDAVEHLMVPPTIDIHQCQHLHHVCVHSLAWASQQCPVSGWRDGIEDKAVVTTSCLVASCKTRCSNHNHHCSNVSHLQLVGLK